MPSWFKKLFKLAFVAVIIYIPTVIIINGGYIWYRNHHRALLQTLALPNRETKFILLMDLAGFEDPSWYVYQLPINEPIPNKFFSAHNTDEVLFWNYSEAGEHYENPHIEIKKKFLVFSRGGLYYSLFDIENKKVLVNVNSPYGYFMAGIMHLDNEPISTSTKKIKINSVDDWVKEILHKKIEKIIDDST